MDFPIAGTVRGKDWMSDGCGLMVKRKAKNPRRSGIKMDAVFNEATRDLQPALGFLRDSSSFSHPVYRTIRTMQVVQTRYRNFLVRNGWNLFIGGKFEVEPYHGERYIVAKNGRDVVAIVAPMRKP